MAREYITPVTVRTQDELVRQLDNQVMVIYIEGELFDSIRDDIKKNHNAKVARSVGSVGAIIGFFLSGPLAIPIFLGGLTSNIIGRMKDNLKQYDINIDDVRKRITLVKSRGENMYNKHKHIIC